MPVLVQQKVDGSGFFNRTWAEYKAGFGDPSGNYWLGNDRLSELTQTGRYKLRFDLRAVNGTRYWAEYSTFVVLNEAYNYRLERISGYSGNAGNTFLNYNNFGTEFTTYDRDNDIWTSPGWSGNCAVLSGGACWFVQCGNCNFNNVRIHFTWSLRLPLQSTRISSA